MGYFKRTRASDEQLATDPHGQTQTISDTGCLRQHTVLSPALPLRGLARVLRGLRKILVDVLGSLKEPCIAGVPMGASGLMERS